MSNEDMDRAHREDSALERDCREAARMLRAIAASPRLRHRPHELEAAAEVCEQEADHIVAVWD